MARRARDLVLLAVIITVSVLSTAVCQEPCHYGMSVNITGATKLPTGHYVHNDIMYTANQTFEHSDENTTSHKRGCVCLVKNCIRKCCPIGQLYLGKECVVSNDSLVNPFNPPVHSATDLLEDLHAHKHFGLVFGNPCLGESYILNPYTESSTKDEDAFFIQANGHLYLPNSTSDGPNTHDQMKYCIEAWADNPTEPSDPEWTTKYIAMMCFEDEEEDIERDVINVLYSIGMIISIPFLMVTFLVYGLIPELQNLHGKALMSYVFGLVVAYTALASIQLVSQQSSYTMSNATCYSFAFVIYFSFMLSFFWLNVMCFDIWWTFSGFRARSSGRRASERRRFIIYCMYAWGLPLIFTGICALMEFNPNIPNTYIKPDFASHKCWFPDFKPELIYFYMPMMILVVSNLVLFTMTAVKIMQAKRDTAVLCSGSNSRHSQYEKDKQRFNLYWKLFLVMGINWVAEGISFLIGGSQYLWILTDLSNTLHGIVIFIMFVWKRKVKNLIIKRYHLLRYGSTASNARSSSRFRSTNSGFVTNETERSFMSASEDNNITLQDMKSGKSMM